MDRLVHKRTNASKRAHRVRTILRAGSMRPRLSVHISNYHVSAQIIDDATGQALLAVSSAGNQGPKGNMTDKASWVGAQLAAAAKAAKVKQVAFDRGAKQYQGRLKALADAARAGGLEF